MVIDETHTQAPPDDMVDLAVRTARLSPCAKSKRGVVVFGHDKESDSGVDAIANGFNGQPQPFECDGTDLCKELCAKRCVHAEDRVIRQACAVHVAGSRHPRSLQLGRQVSLESLGDLREYEAVHVKLDAAGNLTWGGGPSCWQCSRTVMDVNLGAFWLYERDCSTLDDACRYCSGDACMIHQIAGTGMFNPSGRLCACHREKRHTGLPPASMAWRRYTAEEFHRATLEACSMLAPSKLVGR